MGRLNGLKVEVLVEGRHSAGRGGAIKRIPESLYLRVCRVIARGTPTERERRLVASVSPGLQYEAVVRIAMVSDRLECSDRSKPMRIDRQLFHAIVSRQNRTNLRGKMASASFGAYPACRADPSSASRIAPRRRNPGGDRVAAEMPSSPRLLRTAR